MGNLLSSLFAKQSSQSLQTTKQSQQKKIQQTKVPKQQSATQVVAEKTMTDEEKAILELCTTGYLQLDEIVNELLKADISMESASKLYIDSLQYITCNNCLDKVARVESLYTKFVAKKLQIAIIESQKNRKIVSNNINLNQLNQAAAIESVENGDVKISKNTLQNLTAAKNKLQQGQDAINEILTAVPESNIIANKEKRAIESIDGFKLSDIDNELDILTNLFVQINNLLMNVFKNKQLQQIKRFFELLLIGTDKCTPEYFEKNNALNNPGNIVVSEIISLEGYKQLLKFAPFQPLLLFHEASNNPLLKMNGQITDKFICDYIGIEKITTTITENTIGVSIKDGISGSNPIGEKRNFYLEGKEIKGDNVSYRIDAYGQQVPYFVTKAGFTIDLGLYNGKCHTIYYSLTDGDTFSIMQTYKIGNKNYVLMCETNTWFDQSTQQPLEPDDAKHLNNPLTEKIFVSQTDIIIHKESISKDEFTVSIDFETKYSNIIDNIFKQTIMNLIAYYSKIVFGNGALDRKTFSDIVKLTEFMKKETKSYEEFFVEGTNILKKIWEKYPTHLLNMCSYANKTIPTNIKYNLPINYPRFKNSDEAALKIIMNRIINYVNVSTVLEEIVTNSTRKIYFETVDLSEYPYSTEPWDIETYPISETSPIYEFKVLNGTTNTYDNRFDYLFTMIDTENKDDAMILNIVADDIKSEIKIENLEKYKRKNDTWNISDVLNEQTLSMHLYTKFVLAALRWQMVLPINQLNSTIFINKNDVDNGCPTDNLLAFLLTPRVNQNGVINDPLFATVETRQPSK